MENKCLIFLLFYSAASSATLIDRSYEELLDKSECIAFVKVKNRESFSDAGYSGKIHSVYESQILDSLRCNDRRNGETLYFAAPGGLIGERVTQINGLAQLEAGEETTVYLTRPSKSLGVPFLIQAETPITGPSGQTSAFLCTRVPASGPSLFWPQRTVKMQPSQSNDPKIPQGALIDAMTWAGTQWSDPNCSDFTFEVGDLVEQRWVGYDWTEKRPNHNIVTLRRPTDGDIYSEWIYTVDALGITSITYIYGTGEIVDADIELNGKNFQFTNCEPSDPSCVISYDLKNTLTHEYGHVLGLDHPPITLRGAPKTTMFAASPKGEIQKRTLSQDDIDGLCFIYPSGKDTKECYSVKRRPQPNILISSSSTGCIQYNVSDASAFLALLAILFFSRVFLKT